MKKIRKAAAADFLSQHGVSRAKSDVAPESR